MSNEMAAYVTHWVVHFPEAHGRLSPESGRTDLASEDYTTATSTRSASSASAGSAEDRRGASRLGFPDQRLVATGTSETWVTSYAGLTNSATSWRRRLAVVNVLPSTPQRQGHERRSVRSVPSRGLFINLGRGATVDERHLLAALESGQIGNAVLDVADPEPMAGDTAVESPQREDHAARGRFHGGRSGKQGDCRQHPPDPGGEEPYPLVERVRGY